MTISEAHRIIDATTGFLMWVQNIKNSNLLELEDDKAELGVLGVKVYTTSNVPCPEHKCKFKYRNGKDFELIIPQISPVCDLIIDNWPSSSAKKLLRHIDNTSILYLANEILGLDDPMMYESMFESHEYHALYKKAPSKLLDAIYNINYRIAYVLRMIEEDESDDSISSTSDQRIIKVIEIMREEKEIKNQYDFAFIMKIMNETKELPSFNSPTSFLEYFNDLKISQLPGPDSIKKKLSATLGKHPSWTFNDGKGEDSKEAKRRNDIGSRFLSLFRKGI